MRPGVCPALNALPDSLIHRYQVPQPDGILPRCCALRSSVGCWVYKCCQHFIESASEESRRRSIGSPVCHRCHADMRRQHPRRSSRSWQVQGLRLWLHWPVLQQQGAPTRQAASPQAPWTLSQMLHESGCTRLLFGARVCCSSTAAVTWPRLLLAIHTV